MAHEVYLEGPFDTFDLHTALLSKHRSHLNILRFQVLSDMRFRRYHKYSITPLFTKRLRKSLVSVENTRGYPACLLNT
jgi:hypothetical protein